MPVTVISPSSVSEFAGDCALSFAVWAKAGADRKMLRPSAVAALARVCSAACTHAATLLRLFRGVPVADNHADDPIELLIW
jgi:hypothetical protein